LDRYADRSTAGPVTGALRCAWRLKGLAGRTLRRAAVLAIAGVVAWSFLTRAPVGPAVHPDRSRVETGVQADVAREVLVTVRDRHGRVRHALADAASVSDFVRREAAALDEERIDALAAANAHLAARTGLVFAAMDRRVEDFADWYFGWTTSYRLAGRATVSALGALIDPRVDDLATAVGADVERYVEARYRAVVLRPEHTDPLLAVAFRASLSLLHQRFAASVERFDRQVQAFLATRTRHLDADPARGVRLALDWDAQGSRLTLAGFDRGVLETGRSLALGLAGASAGRVAGAALGRAGAARFGASLGARLAGPYAARGMATVTGAAAGTAGGAIGVVAGAVVGLGADWLVNEAIALYRRPDFEHEVRALVALNERQWSTAMRDALEQASRAWFGDLTEVLARADVHG